MRKADEKEDFILHRSLWKKPLPSKLKEYVIWNRNLWKWTSTKQNLNYSTPVLHLFSPANWPISPHWRLLRLEIDVFLKGHSNEYTVCLWRYRNFSDYACRDDYASTSSCIATSENKAIATKLWTIPHLFYTWSVKPTGLSPCTDVKYDYKSTRNRRHSKRPLQRRHSVCDVIETFVTTRSRSTTTSTSSCIATSENDPIPSKLWTILHLFYTCSAQPPGLYLTIDV